MAGKLRSRPSSCRIVVVARGWSPRSVARGGALSIVMICVAARAARPSLPTAPQDLVAAKATRCSRHPGSEAALVRLFDIQTVAGRVDNAHVGVPDASVTHVGTADDRRAARSRPGPSTGRRGEQAQPRCLNYAVAAKRGLCDDVGVPPRQASSAALTLSGGCPAKRAR
jgi:hypothetical protein